MRCNQGCWWNERSLNRGLNHCRGLGLGGTFFSDSCSKLEIDEAFQISHKLGLGLAAKFSKAFAIQLDRFRGQYTPRPSAHPPKKPRFVCFPGFPWGGTTERTFHYCWRVKSSFKLVWNWFERHPPATNVSLLPLVISSRLMFCTCVHV
jgi:hypothetical protein